MSTSEQELKGQIAGMREALRSARASARTGRIVGILGVLVGLCIVAAYVLAFINLGKSVAKSQELPKVVQTRMRQLRIEQTLTKVAEEAAPVYLQEGRKLLQDMDLPKVASAEVQIMLKDLEPVVRRELQRVAPELQEVLIAQKDRTLADLEGLLQKKLGDRLATIVGRQEERLQQDLGLDEQTLARLVTNLQDACLGALRKVVERRMGNVEGEMHQIVKIVAEIPALPPSDRQIILDEMVRVLVALLKHNLPDYDVQLDQPAGMLPAPAISPEERARMEAAEAAEAARRAKAEDEEAQKQRAGGER